MGKQWFMIECCGESPPEDGLCWLCGKPVSECAKEATDFIKNNPDRDWGLRSAGEVRDDDPCMGCGYFCHGCGEFYAQDTCGGLEINTCETQGGMTPYHNVEAGYIWCYMCKSRFGRLTSKGETNE